MKLRIQADIQERAPGKFSKAQLSAFLRRHTGSTGYLIALTQAKSRFDLDGQPAGEITEEHLTAAREELARRKVVRQERDQQEQARHQLEAQQRRNRGQLLWDFERTTLTEANFCVLKAVKPEELHGLLEIARKERTEAPPAPPREARRDERRDDRRPAGGRPEGRGGPRRPEQRSEGGRRDQPRGERPPRADRPPRGEGGRAPQPGRKPAPQQVEQPVPSQMAQALQAATRAAEPAADQQPPKDPAE
ncbi:MAG: prop effector ProQ [Rubrivivax sp.]|nr:MAG: prop effector ProQ [Rubrivivax sp.]